MNKVDNRQEICIIGGGITGYAFAWFLTKKTNYTITVIEKEAAAGGLAKGIESEFGFKIDQFYHFLYNNDSENTLHFFHSLGLKPEVIWNDIKSAVFIQNTLFSIDELASFMKVSLLSLKDKLQFLVAMFRVILIDFKTLDAIPSKKYLIRVFGKRNYQIIWEPLMVSKFAEYYKQVPASWIARRIQVTFFSRSLSGKTRYGYIKGTYSQLFSKLESELLSNGVKLMKDVVVRVEQKGNRVSIRTASLGTLHFDKVVVAAPIGVAARIIVHKDVRQQLEKYKELSVFVILLFLRKQFSKYFWINVNEPAIPFTGVIELTNLANSRLFKGLHIVYLSQYLSDKSIFDKNECLKNLTSYLKKINPQFRESDMVKQFSFFATGAAPIPFLNYMKHMPPFQSKRKRIFLLNSSMIFPQDRGVGNSIKLAQKHVDEFIKA